jgi:hypothetical protein
MPVDTYLCAMKAPKTKSYTLRLWQDNVSKLKRASDLGLSSAEIVNEILERHLDSHLKLKAEKISRELAKAA